MPSGSPTSGVGRVIAGRYLLLNRLGSGGMGHVWLAHDQRLACEVALKEIVFRDPAEAGHEREARVARARAEARHAAGLRGHPHVVTVHDVLEHEGLPWIVMEYVAGAVDLRELVGTRGPLAPAECARIGLAVLDALTAGHERGVMHRDVKPANILLAPDRTGAPYGRVLLTDYGISVQPDADETRYTLASVLVGTAGYLAPERATGGAPTPAADLFSLGCTLYHGVEGRGPFERESHLAEITAVVTEEPRPAVRAGALGPVLDALLVKDPARRLSAVEAEAALSRIVLPQAEAYARTQTDLGSQPPWAGTGAPAPPAPPTGPHGAGSGPPGSPQEPGFGPSGDAQGPGFGASGGAQGPGFPGSGDTSGDTQGPPGLGLGPFRPPQGPGFAPPGDPQRPGQGAPVENPRRSGRPGHPQGFGPALLPAASPAGRRRRERPRAPRVAMACGLGPVLALGGVWYALADRFTDGTGPPYGQSVGLAQALREGDCVLADWAGAERFQGTPRLSLDPTCRDKAPDGQVMAFVAAASADEARRLGPGRCEERTRELRNKLADVRSLAVVPTSDGFESAGRRTACLVLGAYGPVYGPLGAHRKPGSAFADTATMQKRDCLDVRSNRDARLVPCEGPHDEEVLGFTRLGTDVTLGEARTESDPACGREVPPGDYGFDPSVYTAGSWTSQGSWKNGTHFVVCTVRKQNGGTMEGTEP
ncbi:serine/threonine-protein kinase [Streptomyces sp. NL15-2K]|uniref:serine/threonine-protein kinase n=1 Tax=Streptomyces sp. NL15-2K TaxID=376149 RepID=UPI000F56CF73|nr:MULTISPECIES: serine/threonine-protein kinase [Actinomycetes]WKX07196.1 septum formation family protein [Kutzneria buriramensis]GCB51606.1 serine/threonine protein kinase [Streptomyces sp. NL15-2K]